MHSCSPPESEDDVIVMSRGTEIVKTIYLPVFPRDKGWDTTAAILTSPALKRNKSSGEVFDASVLQIPFKRCRNNVNEQHRLNPDTQLVTGSVALLSLISEKWQKRSYSMTASGVDEPSERKAWCFILYKEN
ncbi:hypothetical protein F2P81_008392 [Scophthalmus maximus]|uniref:Uncharacterized protein n=1 Tax=Scophthalmus maximus TaxID=52904 RepID=A0A6A4T256_SCOMX|nr:hypothetical protein F2P81_008392 [Scophthalmus maximus]